jgi:hypothetical protein
LTDRYGRPLRRQQPHLPTGIEFMEQRLQKHAAAKTPFRLGDPMGATFTALQCCRCEIAAAEIFA